jgi:hypothetical protein
MTLAGALAIEKAKLGKKEKSCLSAGSIRLGIGKRKDC